MSNLDALLPDGTSDHRLPRTNQRDAAWTQGLILNGKEGTLTTQPLEAMPDEEAMQQLLVNALPPGMNPDLFEIDWKYPPQIRSWDSMGAEGKSKRLYYFKVNIIAKDPNSISVENLEKQAKLLGKRKFTIKNTEGVTPRVAVLHLTDFQTGQADGDGAEGLAKRALEIPALFNEYVRNAKKAGEQFTEVFVPITGDLVEGVQGFYATQTFATGKNNMNSRRQVELATTLLRIVLSEVAKLGLPVHVAAVPGNHGENNRIAGKQSTAIDDNNDIAVVKNVKELFEFHGGYGHVKFSLPKDNRLSLVVRVLDLNVSLTHGHLGRGAGSPEAKITAWAKNMLFAGDPVGNFDILFSGHYHHQRTVQMNGDRWWVMSPAMCDMSDYFAQTSGLMSAPGISFYAISSQHKLESSKLYTFNTLAIEERK